MEQKKRIPPIVPKKKQSLQSLRPIEKVVPRDTIEIAHLTARKEEHIITTNTNANTNEEASIEQLVGSISLKSNFHVSPPKKNEPKAITFDSIMKPTRRTDIKLGNNNHIKTIETPLEKHMMLEELKNDLKFVSSKPIPPPVKPKPKIKIDFNSKPRAEYKKQSEIDNTPEFLKDTIQKRIQLANSGNGANGAIIGGIPLPGLARFPQKINTTLETSNYHPQIHKSHTLDNSNLEKRTQTLTHPNKRRAKGPKRRLPTDISTSQPSSSLASASTSTSPSPSPSPSPPFSSSLSTTPSSLSSLTPPPSKHKVPPPVPRKPSRHLSLK